MSKKPFLRAKPFLVLGSVGLLMAAGNIVQGKAGSNVAEMIGYVMGNTLGMAIWGFPHCFFTRNKSKAEFDKEKS